MFRNLARFKLLALRPTFSYLPLSDGGIRIVHSRKRRVLAESIIQSFGGISHDRILI